MKLDRKQIKAQARELITSKAVALFIISFVVWFLAYGVTTIENLATRASDYAESNYTYSDDQYGKDDFEDFEDFYDDFFSYGTEENDGDTENPLENFGGRITSPAGLSANRAAVSEYVKAQLLQMLSTLLLAISIVFCPLLVALAGYYVRFIRTADEIKIGRDLGGIFKDTFNKTYGKRLGLVLLRQIFSLLLMLLLLVPGIVYLFSTYFANELMSDNPNLKPTEALKLSRKMVEGHRTELFVMELSFIPWWLLSLCTCGLASIYVLPYYRTTRALYYQNFRARSLAIGQTTEDDYLSRAELERKYGPAPGYGPYYPPQNGTPNYTGAYPPPYGNAPGQANGYNRPPYGNASGQANGYNRPPYGNSTAYGAPVYPNPPVYQPPQYNPAQPSQSGASAEPAQPNTTPPAADNAAAKNEDGDAQAEPDTPPDTSAASAQPEPEASEAQDD